MYSEDPPGPSPQNRESPSLNHPHQLQGKSRRTRNLAATRKKNLLWWPSSQGCAGDSGRRQHAEIQGFLSLAC